MRNKFLIYSYFVTLLVTTFDIVFDENIPLPSFYSAIKMWDELYIGILFVFTLLYKKKKRNNYLLLLLGILLVVGIIGNISYHSSIKTIILGAYSTLKPILLCWSFSQYNFSWADFHKFKKLICSIFPLVFVSYILDLLIPTFRYDIGIVAQAEEVRMGLRSLGGLFNRFTAATMYALLFFLFYKYYDKKHKWRIIFADFMFFSAMKIKDILGFLLARSFTLFKKFKIKYIVITAVFLYILILIYAQLMPEHYNEYFNSGEDGNIARVVLGYTSLSIMVDKFPFGTGWGLFASPTSQQIESPIYAEYGINNVYGLSYEHDNGVFMSDTFWPMIFGELGFLGTALYIYILWNVFSPFLKGFFKDTSNKNFIMPAFIFITFLGISIGKPVFSGPPHCLLVWGIAGIFYSLKNKNYVSQQQIKKSHT